MIDLSDRFPPTADSVPAGINNNEQIVGTTVDYGPAVESIPHPFLFSDGKLFDLEKLVTDGLDGWSLQHAVAINDSGQIVATSGPIGGVAPPFFITWRLDPIP